MRKSLKDISLLITEEEYRADSALSYSTLARYEREGFNNIDNLFDKIESPSLTFGSMVDTLITSGQDEFDKLFFIAEFPQLSDTLIKIVKRLFSIYKDRYTNINDIPTDDIIYITQEENYQLNWKPETRVKVVKEKCGEYYNLLYIAGDRTIVDTETYKSVLNCVDTLHNHAATKFFFEENNPFNSSIERFYQLKFKATLNNVDYRCMFDELVVNHSDKTIQPIDLKTSCNKSDREWDFAKHYVAWGYSIQNRLYVRILQDVISKDNIYKDYKILPYKDIIIFKDSNIPMVYDIPFTHTQGTLYFGKNKQIEMRDPFDIGNELNFYLKNRPRVPIGFHENCSNDIEIQLNKL